MVWPPLVSAAKQAYGPRAGGRGSGGRKPAGWGLRHRPDPAQPPGRRGTEVWGSAGAATKKGLACRDRPIQRGHGGKRQLGVRTAFIADTARQGQALPLAKRRRCRYDGAWAATATVLHHRKNGDGAVRTGGRPCETGSSNRGIAWRTTILEVSRGLLFTGCGNRIEHTMTKTYFCYITSCWMYAYISINFDFYLLVSILILICCSLNFISSGNYIHL